MSKRRPQDTPPPASESEYSPFDGLIGRLNPEVMGDTAVEGAPPPAEKNFVPAGFVPEGDVMVIFSARIPQRLRDRIKADAARRRMTVQDYLAALIERGY